MKTLLLVLALLLRILVLALPSVDAKYKIKESVISPKGWVKQSPAPPNETIQLRIGLPQANFHILQQHLFEISDPHHERYGDHLSKEEVEELVAPHPQSLSSVNAWLRSFGIKEEAINRSPSQDWVTISVPVRLAEVMLDTVRTYHSWKHFSGEMAIRTTTYSLPSYIWDHVETVQPTTMFARLQKLETSYHWNTDTEPTIVDDLPPILVESAAGSQVNASCNSTITVTCLKQLYNAVGYKPTALKENRIALAGYLEEYANIQDLQSFYAAEVPEAINSSFEVVKINGGQNPQNESDAGVEANLDTQFALGLSYPTPGTYYSTGGSPPYLPSASSPNNTNEPYANWLDYVLSSSKIPQTISTSYGDAEQTVPESYARRVCAGFAQLGARGVTVLFSSGDGGVGDGDPDPSTQTCQTNDGRNVTRFSPGFPASCPFVTAVGGTTYVPEVGIDLSGGGFSNYFPRPPYQERAVEKYLSGIPEDTYKGLFNRNGRGIPDVSAQANHFLIYYQGRSGRIGGTSAAAPTFAGIVALLNDARLASGLPSLGFLNPLLYSPEFSEVMNDITEGNNPGCGTNGFNATTGWDPVTGLGTANFERMKELITSPWH